MKNIRVILKNILKIDPRLMRRFRKILSPFRRIGLKKNFTIFSDNCWGGRVYDKFGIKYLTPTIGLSLSNFDFIKFLNNYDNYCKYDLIPIVDLQQKVNNEWGIYDCMLGDIQIKFRHYRNVNDAINKWNRRKERIQNDNIIVKMSYYENNEINYKLIEDLIRLPYKKILFTNKIELLSINKIDKIVIIPNEKGDNEFILSDKNLKLKELKAIINS